MRILMVTLLFLTGMTATQLQAQTCAKRSASSPVFYQGKSSVVINDNGLPNRVQSGLNQAAPLWGGACANATNVPEFSVVTGNTPASPVNYDPEREIFIRVLDQSPPWDKDLNGWKAAIYTGDRGGGVSQIDLYLRCPLPQGNKTFTPCTSNNLVAWDSSHGAMILAHEFGHALGLTHDVCNADSVMQESTPSNARILTAHCQLADALNCDPNNPPAGGCPVAPDGVGLTAEVSGLGSGDTLTLDWELFCLARGFLDPV